jgi:hypothetical protein
MRLVDVVLLLPPAPACSGPTTLLGWSSLGRVRTLRGLERSPELGGDIPYMLLKSQDQLYLPYFILLFLYNYSMYLS